MREIVLRARQIVKTFHDGELDTQVLKGIDLEIAAGDFLALMGPSGSGKSTLMAILGTLLRPTSGTIEVAGKSTHEVADAALTGFRNRHLGFVFQFHHLLPDFTARENVMFPALAYHGRETAQARQRATDLLQRVGLGHRLDYKTPKLSGGQKQRVALARAVMMKPELVLADEPTGNLDLSTGHEIIEILQDLKNSRGVTIITATHDMKMLAASDRVVWITDGKISRIQSRDELNIRVGTIDGHEE